MKAEVLKKVILITIICLYPFKNFASAPAMHVFLGERWLAKFAPEYQEEDKKLFLLGTVFPDIRYLGVIKREQTHFKNVTLQKIRQEKSAFKRGMLLHSYVDELRENYAPREAVEKKLSDIPRPLQGTFLKLLEDQILQDKLNWALFRSALLSIPEEEKKIGIPEKSLAEWHTGLTVYFSVFPSLLLMQLGMMEQKIFILDAPTVKLWGTLLPQYTHNKEVQQYLDGFIKTFDKKLKSA